ncbi:hypothetical protein FHS04_002065 [Mesoflavibacter sabulilitoris]|uniref:Uncharacterized protein n=1 Tax=Mesoflavibacter zeaxanthinifaciens subsp. sabulilitoris TaxID=1520893 RepID=A0A2T1NLZ3_9FLAO|nr:DUF4268 domain-containing protein [Mesoflavibacter zeaxanthinifaciens]MBB3124542.1 hypothetical protein [Mesoflavibacter zeaxanthinifaciens subsp. sabulilitoris]PSG93910.1 hypothetical protein C7H61_01685 [Mesoflavibacter zeaxanthinifaciens subsp. sabulilitoris]
MYRINREQNNIEKLDERLFKDLGFRERDHLQEWIAKNPDVLGEDFLIIQKEFSGFNDTNERLDLLALDKEGNLVIIENKLDDTGKDVTWQALKYASYCSTLTTKQILDIFQDYLSKSNIEESAEELIYSFLELTVEELYLNSGDQRIIFVANHYRKEVTSTVLWLLDHDIQVQCFRATPFSQNEEIFLQIEQIIPLPETEEFMIDAQEKKREDLEKSKGLSETKKTQLEFWRMFKDKLLENNSIQSVQTPKPRYWFNVALGKSGITLSNIFNVSKGELGVRVYISSRQVEEWLPYFIENKSLIENYIGESILWDPNPGNSDKIIVLYKTFELQDKTNWVKALDWMTEKTISFKTIFSDLISNK